jgi:hypothetical protein
LLRLDPETAGYRMSELAAGQDQSQTTIVCVNGNETAGWTEEREFVRALSRRGHAVVEVDPRGVGGLCPKLAVAGHDYIDPLDGVEENIAYNAFLVGKSLLGMRVTDVLAVVRKLIAQRKPKRIVLCGRRDAALVACLAAAVEPAIDRVAVEDLLPSYRSLFSADGRTINAASIVPGLLQRFDDIANVLLQIAPRKVLVSGGSEASNLRAPSISIVARRFTQDAKVLLDWLMD